MFLHLSVILLTQGGGGVHDEGGGACMTRGDAFMAKGGVHGKGGMCGEGGHAW